MCPAYNKLNARSSNNSFKYNFDIKKLTPPVPFFRSHINYVGGLGLGDVLGTALGVAVGDGVVSSGASVGESVGLVPNQQEKKVLRKEVKTEVSAYED
jgi:hypothetical protein